MGIAVFWQLPVEGDGHSIRQELWNRGDYSPHRKQPHPYARTGVKRDGYTFYDHLSQVAGAADLARFDGLWIPQTSAGEEPLIVAGAFAREARNSKLLASLRAPLISAVYATKIANSFQRLSGGRLAWNLVTEEDQPRTWHGRHWSVAEQIERTGEFLDVAKGFWHNAPFTYEGKYFEVLNGGFAPALQGETFPVVYLSGETDEAYALSARHADVHVFPLESVEVLRDKIARLNALAAEKGRTLRYGISSDIVARYTDEEAWEDLRRRFEENTHQPIPINAEVAQNNPAPRFDELITAPNIWSGFAHVRNGAPAGLVGGYAEITERIAEYAAIGIDTFVLSSNPALEEAYRLGEKLLPRIRAISLTTSVKSDTVAHRPAKPDANLQLNSSESSLFHSTPPALAAAREPRLGSDSEPSTLTNNGNSLAA